MSGKVLISERLHTTTRDELLSGLEKIGVQVEMGTFIVCMSLSNHRIFSDSLLI